MSKLVVAITDPNQHDFEGWKQFRNENLFRPGGITFQANLFPLGKNTTSNWPDHYKSVFGFGGEDFRNYKKRVTNDRFCLLRSAWKDVNPVITICFGSTFWNYYEDLLKPVGPYDRCDKFRIYEKSGIALTPFFDYRFMPHSLINKLANKLRPFWENHDFFNNLRPLV